MDGVSTAGAERIGAGQRRIHGVAVINVIAAPVVAKLMTDQVGLARGTEPSFAKAVPNVRTADGVEVGHTNGAAIKVAPAKHLDQIALNTLLAANPMASNLIEQAASISCVVGVTGVASDNDGRDGVRDVDFWFIVKAIHIVDIGVDFGLRISAIVLVELVIHITRQFAFIEKPAEKSGRQVRNFFEAILKFFIRKDRKVVDSARSFAWFYFGFMS